MPQEALNNILKDIKPPKITNQPTGNIHLRIMSHKGTTHRMQQEQKPIGFEFHAQKGFVDFSQTFLNY